VAPIEFGHLALFWHGQKSDARQSGWPIRAEEVDTMQWDLGLQGVAVLIGMSLILGVFTQVVFWNRTTGWLWLIVSAASFVVGAFISEVWFGWATVEALQPNIDGLSFDEVLLGGLLGGVIVLVTRYLTRSSPGHQPMAS
jgi:Na+/proline symporter